VLPLPPHLRPSSCRVIEQAAQVRLAVEQRHRPREPLGAKWELTALEAIGMLEVEGLDDDDDPTATRVYCLAERYRRYESVASFFTPRSGFRAHGGLSAYFAWRIRASAGGEVFA